MKWTLCVKAVIKWPQNKTLQTGIGKLKAHSPNFVQLELSKHSPFFANFVL